jgi:hypothetical protein
MLVLTLLLVSSLCMIVSAEEQVAEVHLNHAYVVPDLSTYEAIRSSDLVKQLAVWEERTTRRRDQTYTGFYLYGRHTYFEFLLPSEKFRVGEFAVAFGVDRSGELDRLQRRAEAAGMKTEIQEIRRPLDGTDVAWFRSLSRTDYDQPHVNIWTLEYVPTFLTEWHPSSVGKSGVRREEVLSRYAGVVRQKHDDKPMADVTDLWIDLAPSDLRESLRECEVLGFQVSGGDCTDGQFTVHLKESTKTIGLTKVRFALHKPMAEGEHQIGATKLTIEGKAAIWNFAN